MSNEYCKRNMTYCSQESATSAAIGFGGQGLRVFFCEEHNGWHFEKKKGHKRKPCPRCGETTNRFRSCRCMRDALQEADPWRAGGC